MSQQTDFQQHVPTRRPAVWWFVVAAVLAAAVAGAGVYLWQRREAKLQVEELTRTYAIREDSLRKSLRPETELRDQVFRLQDEINVLRQFSYRHQGKLQPEFLEVYECDMHYNTYTGFHIAVPEDLPLLQKMRLLADRLSVYRFGRLPIEVLKIENREGKRIAVIDLRESGYSERPSWSTGYFQGSTGGGMTQTTLVGTFLQPDYEGDWVDGIEFYYEGKPMEEWDHINLVGTIYRKADGANRR